MFGFARARRFALVAVVALGALAACAPNVDLTAVQQYAVLAQQSQASFDAIAGDYDASCERQRELNLRADYLTWKPDVASASNTPHAGQKPFFGTTVQETCVVTTGYAKYPLGAVSRDWKLANQTLLEYIHSLGALANVAAAPTPAIAPLTGAAVAANLIPAPQATNIATFANAIVAYWQRNARERDVARFLEAVNTVDPTTGKTSFAGAVEALDVAGSAYAILIYNECTEITNLYAPALRVLSTMAHGANEPLVIERAHRIRLHWASDLRACAVHQNAAAGYLATLKKLSAANDALVKAEREPLTSRAALFTDLADLSDSVSALYALLVSKTAVPAP
jgi:hypothetical protein